MESHDDRTRSCWWSGSKVEPNAAEGRPEKGPHGQVWGAMGRLEAATKRQRLGHSPGGRCASVNERRWLVLPPSSLGASRDPDLPSLASAWVMPRCSLACSLPSSSLSPSFASLHVPRTFSIRLSQGPHRPCVRPDFSLGSGPMCITFASANVILRPHTVLALPPRLRHSVLLRRPCAT